MAPGSEDRQSHQDTAAGREPLVNINVNINSEPASAGELEVQRGLRRKRLSDVQGQAGDPQPEPESKPQRRRLSGVRPTNPAECAPELQPASGRPRLRNIQSQTAVLETPDDSGRSHMDNGVPVSAQPDTTAPAQPHVDAARIEQWIVELRARQSLSFAAIGGLLAAVVGALVWAVVTVVTSFQISWMAIGVGLLVGGVVRALGRGLDRRFGSLGAGLSLLSCILGNYLANCMFIAREAQLPVASVLTQINPAAIPRLMMVTFHPLDILFYALAVYIGYHVSFRRITEAQINRALGNA